MDAPKFGQVWIIKEGASSMAQRISILAVSSDGHWVLTSGFPDEVDPQMEVERLHALFELDPVYTA